MKPDSILILAAGKGTRLQSLTSNTPKCALPLDDSTIISRLITQINEIYPSIPIFVNASYLAEKIVFELSKIPIPTRPTIIYEKDLLGPAATVKNLLFSGVMRPLVIHGDLVCTNKYMSTIRQIINNSSEKSIVFTHKRWAVRSRSEIVKKQDGSVQITEKINSKSIQHKIKNIFRNQLSFSGILQIANVNLINYHPNKGDSLSPNLINFISTNFGIVCATNSETRISVDSIRQYKNAKMVARI